MEGPAHRTGRDALSGLRRAVRRQSRFTAAPVCQSCGTRGTSPTRTGTGPRGRDGLRPHAGRRHARRPSRRSATARILHACTACGGQIVFIGHALSENCPYCNGAVVRGPEEAAYATMGLIPFRLSGPRRLDEGPGWIARRLAAPRDLSGRPRMGGLRGFTRPSGPSTATRRSTYWARYNVRSGKNTRIRTVKGSMRTRFNDLLVPASPHVTALIRDGILHYFRPRDLRAFRPGYLAGFAAERHHQTVAEGLRANEDDKALLIRNRIKAHEGRRTSTISAIAPTPRASITGASCCRSGSCITSHRGHGLPCRRLRHRRAHLRRTTVLGGKLALYSGAITAVAIGVGLVWGAAGFL
jgi:predicted RNA-binding Zn-ribbon protein involved in translation (DUF1610 family)